LRPWERWLAGLFGATGTGVGGIGIFLSDNQAGTTAILLLGAIFVLIAIQGTPLRSASRESIELSERQVVDLVAEKAENELEEDEPERARATIEGASAVRPDIEKDPRLLQLTAKALEREVVRAVERAVLKAVGATNRIVSTEYPWKFAGAEFDALIELIEVGQRGDYGADSPHKRVVVEVSIAVSGRVFGTKKLRHDLAKFALVADEAALLLVSNQPLSELGREVLDKYMEQRQRKVRFVVWRDDEDDPLLTRACSELLAE
jgi:hypothetical protein